MNELRRIAILAPCEGMADFPTYFRGADTAQLLAAWCVAWRPSLIAAAGQTPEVVCSYHLADSADIPDPGDGGQSDGGPGHGWAGTVLLAPSPAIDDAVRLWIDDARLRFGDRLAVVDSFESSSEIIAHLSKAPLTCPVWTETPFDHELSALGYALQQVFLLIGGEAEPDWFDRAAFDGHAVSAAEAAVAGDAAAVDRSLRAAYDQLETLRNHTYPTEVWLLDLVLVGETTLGDRLGLELTDATPKTLRLTRSVAERIAESKELAAGLRKSVADGRLSLALGDPAPGEGKAAWALFSPEAMADEIDVGLDAIDGFVGERPSVGAPWSASLPPRLTQALAHRGFRGLIVGSLDGGDTLFSEHTKADLSTPEGVVVPAVVRRPHDLAAPETFLKWGELLAETLQIDPVATLSLTGWAGCRNEFLLLLRTVAQRSPVLGVFVTADRYFAETASAERDATPAPAFLGPSTKLKPHPMRPAGLRSQASEVEHHLIAGLANLTGAASSGDPAADCAAAIGVPQAAASGAPADGEPVAINPWSFSVEHTSAKRDARYRLPSCGFAVGQRTDAAGSQQAAGQTLRNEYARLEIDPESGGLRALHVPGVRGPLLSQRIAVGHARNRGGWVSMTADPPEDNGLATVTPGDACLTTTGIVRDRRGGQLARYTQTVTLAAARPWFVARVELEPLAPAAEYRCFAWRLMLRDLGWRAFRGAQWQRLPHEGARAAATDYYELRSGSRAVSLAADGPLLIRRQGEQAVDVVLADGLTEPTVSELMVGFGSQRALAMSLAQRTPPLEFVRPRGSGGADSGWWLHVDAPSVIVSRIEPLPAGGAEGRARIHLIETNGRPVQATLRAWRPLRSVEGVEITDQSRPASLSSGNPNDVGSEPPRLDEAGVAHLSLVGHGWLRIEVSW